ncbi:Methyltransferase-like protein 5 [Oopsacas minuta]|uniref:Methyltransferase-like protein 5 n=1 Tax=Oopsacas minuta TaxID=111878 RepID=A0AAV7JN89_9METZ|nr:Methyltransferase-like protein 5 [Oopsacas minuta]
MCTGLSEKELYISLSQIDGYHSPKLYLEQYITPPNIAATIIKFIDEEYQDIRGKNLLDLGCGTGMLSIGSCLLGSHSFGIDVCQRALGVARENISRLGVNDVDFICGDITNIKQFFIPKKIDTVLMNPPFGTKDNYGIDIKFIDAAISVSCNSIYSLHKTTTRKHILEFGEMRKLQTNVLAEIRFNIDNTFKFHKKKSVDIDVDLIKFEVCD